MAQPRRQTTTAPAAPVSAELLQPEDLGIAQLDIEAMRASREDGESYKLNVLDLNREPALLHPTKGFRPGDTWEGIIIHNHPGRERREGTVDARGRRVSNYDADNPLPPNCASWDGVTGYGYPGGACATCPCAQRGGDCMPVYHLFVLPVDGILPVHVRVPVTSVRAVRKYVDLARFTRGPLTGFVTVFGAEEKGEGSVLTLTAGQKLSREAAAGVKAYAELVRSILEYPTPVGQAAEPKQLADPTSRPKLGAAQVEPADLDVDVTRGKMGGLFADDADQNTLQTRKAGARSEPFTHDSDSGMTDTDDLPF